MTGVVAAPGRALVSLIVWGVVALVVGTVVRLALARGEGGRPVMRIVKRARTSERDAA